MKTLNYTVVLFCTLSFMALIGCQTKEGNQTIASVNKTKAITLNGLDSAEADQMVKRFLKSRKSSHQVTSFWFNEQFLDAIISVLHYEGADGVRFYFAKDSLDRNALVMISTKENGDCVLPENKGKKIHQEYFAHSTLLLGAPYANYTAEYGIAPGANLYGLSNHTQTCLANPHYVSTQVATEWANEFKDDQKEELQPLTTLSVWYDLQLFINLKNYLIAAKVRGYTGDGFRIYFVKKPKHDAAGQDVISLLFVPTVTSADKKSHDDYYDCFEDVKKMKNFLKLAEVRTEPNDNGEECPTFCNEGTTWNNKNTTTTEVPKPKK